MAAIAASDLSQAQKKSAAIEARRMLESYRRSGFDRAAIGKSLDRVVAWAKDNGVPPNRIFLGEFGVMKSEGLRQAARAVDRLQWFADVRAEAAARDFFWAAWVYRGAGGFGLTEDGHDVNIDPGIVAALGLKPRTRHGAAPIE
jgi:hypothetical protein